MIRLCEEEPGGWDYTGGKKEATWRYAIRQVFPALLIAFSSRLCVVVYSEMKSVYGVLSSFKCRCVYANSKLREFVRRHHMLFCFHPLISSLFLDTLCLWQCHKHKVSAHMSDTIHESVHSDVAFRTYPWAPNTSYAFFGSVPRHSVQKQHKIPLSIM